MTAGRERSAGQAALSVAARDRVVLRGAGGITEPSDRDSTRTHRGVDGMLTPLEATLARLIEKAVRHDRAAAARLTGE